MLHFHFAEQGQGSSLLHGLDPRIKIVGVVLFVAASTILPFGSWLAYFLLFGATLVAARFTGLGTTYALKRSFVALPFALAAITLPFTVPGQTIAHFGGLTVTAEGSIRLLSIVIKSWVSVQMAILLTATTPVHDLLWGMRELRVPRPLVSIIGFMYRYLFVLADESLRLMRARAARAGAGAGRSGGSLVWRGRVAGGMVGSLMLRAFERSERIYDAMVARGFKGDILAMSSPVITDSDRNALVGWVTFLAMVLLIGFVF
ncbi:MAG: cobalt ECF transporter T component CbiQ [Chloroflexota bacterium]